MTTTFGITLSVAIIGRLVTRLVETKPERHLCR